MKKEELILVFEYLLSRGPCRNGIQLRSEPELGRIFNENRQKIRRVLDDFVERGFIFRKHGSGTFVRKAFPAAEAPEATAVARLIRISPEQIFLLTPRASKSPHPDRTEQSLRIGIPNDIRFLMWTDNVIFEAARSRIEFLGHVAVPYEQYNLGLENFKSPEQLAEEFRLNRCDGYLFESLWYENMQEALHLAFGKTEVPAIYFWPGSTPVNCQPLIQIDTDEAVRRAVDLFAGFGYRRIALINMEDSAHPALPERVIYQRQIAAHRFDYEEVVTLVGPIGSGLANSLDALFERHPPDAVYIADDHYLPVFQRWLEQRGIEPGRDLGIIALSNAQVENVVPAEWSRLEFDPAQVGLFAVDHLVRTINSPNALLCNFSHQATWKPGISTVEQKK